jgi:(2Fe-2S) ferredoxin
MPGLQRHVFVCVNERAATNPKGCCKLKGGDKVRDAFKKRLTDLGLKRLVRANNAGCLDQCEHGVTVLVYPEQVWYGGVTAEDVPEIIERHILRGEFVERLMLPEQPHLYGATSAPPLDHPAARSIAIGAALAGAGDEGGPDPDQDGSA